MAVPTLVKTWQFDLNNLISEGDDLTMRSELMFQLKEILTDGVTFTVPWTVYSSCDAVTAGTAGDAVDRWIDNGDVVWSVSGDRSWIVLMQTDYFSVGTHLYMCIECDYSATTQRNGAIGLYFSNSAFSTGGSLTARPTAANEFEVLPSGGTTITANWQGFDANTELTKRLNVMGSNDGEEWRIAIAGNGVTQAVWALGKADSAPSGWTMPFWVMVYGQDSNTSTVTAQATTIAGTTDRVVHWDGVLGRFISGFTGVSPRYAETGYMYNALNSTFDSSRPLSPVGLYSDTAPAVGPLGNCIDMFWAPISDAQASTYASQTFINLGGLTLPWDGSTTPLWS